MRLSLLKGKFAVCRLDKFAPLPGWLLESMFFSISRTPDELSLVCSEDVVPGGALCNKGWRCLRVEGPLPFDMVGVISSIAGPLAKVNVPIFVFSTYDTDYVMVKDADVEKAVDALAAEGHSVNR